MCPLFYFRQERVIRLPEYYPEKGIPELMNYIGYIVYKAISN